MPFPAGQPAGGFRLLSRLYGDAPTAEIWSEEQTVANWLRVEAALAQAQGKVGLIAASDAVAIARACDLGNIDLPALWEAARTVGYPILPLVRQIAGSLPPGPSGWVHFGSTTQDIMDTALSLQLQSTCQRLDELAVSLGDALGSLARKHAHNPMAGRTHGQQAVPTTFGAKCAVFLAEVARELSDLRQLGPEVAVVSLFGAAGTNAAMGPAAARVRQELSGLLGLGNIPVPWHVSRDRIARFGSCCSLLAATCVRFAREIVDLSRTEVAEVQEEYGHHRGASSTMPHKVNPIFSESVVAFGVAAEGAAALLYRAMEAGHERSAGEWQIEWLAVPEVALYSAAALGLCARIASELQVDPAAMTANMSKMNGLLMSESLMMRLAPTLGRERAHDVVYQAAVRVRATGEDLLGACLDSLRPEEREGLGYLAKLGDPGDYLGDAPEIALAAAGQWESQRCAPESRPR